MRSAGMFRSAVLALALSSCVPAGEESDPRGALGITTVPSPGSRGEPFVTADGWTVHVEQLVVLAEIRAQATDPASTDDFQSLDSSYQGPYLFKASSSESFVAPGLPVGKGRVGLGFQTLLVDPRYPTPEAAGMMRETRGVEPSLVDRFFQPADFGGPFDDMPDMTLFGPSILLVARAERAQRNIRIDFTFRGANTLTPEIPLEIRANALNDVSVKAVAENLFAGPLAFDAIRCVGGRAELPTSRPSALHPVFDDLASADTDGDGVLSLAELRHRRAPACECCSPELKETVQVIYGSSMASLLEQRSLRLFVPATP